MHFRIAQLFSKKKLFYFMYTASTLAKGAILKMRLLIQYHLDGEYAEAPKLAIEILPAALQFRF